jgi:hypothetical protein
MCTEAAVLAIGSTGIPLQIVVDPWFRNLLVKVAKCSNKSLNLDDDVKLAHRKELAVDLIPKVDKELDERTRPPVMKVASSLGATMMSDGWKDVASRNFLNILIINPTGRYFLKTVDVKDQTKDAKFIADFIKAIEDVQVETGKCNVTAAAMDGACESSFVAIQAKLPTITKGPFLFTKCQIFLNHHFEGAAAAAALWIGRCLTRAISA